MRLAAEHTAGLLPYDRKIVTPGIVHLGVGAFQRAHIAVYIDSLLSLDPSWGIVGASLRRPDMRNALLGQDFLYTLAIQSAEGTKTRLIGSLLDVLDANTQRAQLLEIMSRPAIRIVTLTVTEKGYCHDPATGKLDPNHPDIIHDLDNPEAPVSAPGLIVRALELRRNAGIPPFTVLSCDNLPANGQTTSRVVTDFANLRDIGLARHIAQNVAFPSTMIDRIVPATTDVDRAMVKSETGFDDAWPVVTESFSQWVVEDRFAAGRPPFEKVGVDLVNDVAPYELMKLRMLNGSHSTLAYLGYLAGHEYVSQAIADPALLTIVQHLMTQEAIPTLPMDHTQLLTYRDALLARFSNPALKHRTWQIAMDGSQKLPQRLLGTIRDCLKANRRFDHAALGVAAWMRYVTGIDEHGKPIDVRDPLASRFKAIADDAGADSAALVDGFLNVSEIFGSELPKNLELRNLLEGFVAELWARGAISTAQRLASANGN
jgi:fructuronate reductase